MMDKNPSLLNRPFQPVLTVLALVAAVLVAIILTFWLAVRPEQDTLPYEAVKTSMQVLGVVVIGGLVSVVTSIWQQERERAAEHVENQRKENAEEMERRREEFNLRTTLLDRTSRCAQGMYVTCQHVSRVQRDQPPNTNGESQQLLAGTLALLNESYLEFSAEAAALQTELGARYGINTTDNTVRSVGEAYLRWHQVVDLLTVYYFNLCGNFRRDILVRNSRSDTDIHSGLDFRSMVKTPRQPTTVELRAMRGEIRKEFIKTMPLLADAVLEGTLRNV